jgi:hypothetical protein
VIPGEHRAKSAPQLGAKGPGQSGPFGPYPDDDQEDLDLASLANDRIAQQLDAARARRDRRQQQRQDLNERRQHGLVQRHRDRLARLDERDQGDEQPPPEAA